MIQNANLEKSIKEANHKKILSLSIAIGFLIIIFIICALILAFKPALEDDKVPTKDSISSTYFDSPQEWTPSTGVCNQPSSNLLGANNQNTSIPSECTLYTYDNNFGVYSRPNTKSVISDYLNGLVQAEKLPDTDFCVDRDQIVAQKVVHQCIGPNCLSVFGNNIKKGTDETFSAACVQNNNICKDLLASISFNFRLYYSTDSSKYTNNLNTITDTTVCLSVKNIIVPNRIFSKIPQFYKDAGIFTLGSDNLTIYPAIITFENCNPLDYKQKFRIQRYTYTSEAGAEPGFVQTSGRDNTGFFCNIIYRIGNLRLSYDETKNSFCFVDNDNKDPTWLLMPELDLSTNKISTIQRFQMSNYFSDQNPVWIKATEKTNANTKNPYFSTFVSPATNLEVIDTTKIVNPKNIRYVQDNNSNLGGDLFDTEAVFSVYFTDKQGDSTNFDTIDSDNEEGGDFPLGDQTYFNYPIPPGQYYWEARISTGGNNTIYSPTLGQGPGRIYHRYQMANDKNVVNTQTFFGTLTSDDVYEVTFRSSVRQDSYLTVYAGLSPSASEYAPAIKTFSLKSGDFYIQDGEALWKRIPIYQGINQFQGSYFTDNYINGGPILTFAPPNSGTTAPVKYIVPKKGLISLIDFSESNIENPISVQDLPTLPSIGISSSQVIGNNSNATGEFLINFGANSSGQQVEIRSFNIINNGENNKGNTNLDIPIPGSSMTVKNAKFVVIDQDILYQAVPGTSGSGGATFDATVASEGTSLKNVTIDFGGYGYQKNEIVYIVQTDSSGEVKTEGLNNITTLEDFSTYPDERKKLVNIKVNTVGEPISAPYNLLRPGENLPNTYLDYYPYFNKTYSGIPPYLNGKIFGKSPPQIAFLGHGETPSPTRILAQKFLANSTNPEDFLKFFTEGKNSGSLPGTPVNYIKTIQFRDLNYTFDSNANFFTNPNSNQLSTGDNPVLGRFIPYKYFNTLENFESNDVNSNGFLYNNNYTQFIPYGLKHIYETYIDLKDLPSF